MGGMIAVIKMRDNIFMPIGYFETLKHLSGSFRDCRVDTLDMPTNKLQNVPCGMSKKVITWHHPAVGAFLFLQKDIYRRGDTNKPYANVANVLGIDDVSTLLEINV